MSSIVLAVAVVAGIGLAAGVLLAVAAVVMHVQADERVEQLTAALPGVNCGACGYSGCERYAEAIVSGAATNLCAPGGGGAAKALAEIMGVEAQPVLPRKAFVRCNGTRANCGQRFEYRGGQSCAAASLFYGGQKACNDACLGFGDCARVCPHGAIEIADGIARIDASKCVGCALCAMECPKRVIVMTEAMGKALNRCRSEAPGAAARKQCTAACTGCGLCVKACPEGAVAIENNLARVDQKKCVGCGLCVSKCPAGCLDIRF